MEALSPWQVSHRILASPTSQGLQHNPGFAFTASHMASLGFYAGTPLPHTWPEAFLNCRGRFHNSFTPVSPRTLRSELPGQCCQVQSLELEPVPFLNYICITFSLLQLFSSRKFPKAFPFYSRISCGWGLALRTALPLFHFASDLSPLLIFQYKH